MRYSIIAGLCLIGSVASAAAENATFTDALKPNGHARSAAVRRADGRACGSAGGHIDVAKFPAFRECMRAKGWELSRLARTPAERARDRAIDEAARPWCYGAYCAPDDSACMDDPSNTFSLCPDSP